MESSDSAQTPPESSPPDLWDQMFDAAEQGSEAELRARLEQWKHLGLEQKMIDMTLNRAVGANQAGHVRLLMEYGARAEYLTIDIAREDGASIEVWQALLDGGWDPNSHSYSQDPLIFHFLSDPSDTSMLLWLLAHGASAEARSTRTGLNAISLAAGHRPVPMLRTLLMHSEFFSNEKLNRTNAVHQAASNKNEDRTAALALLVDELGADVNGLSTYGKCAPRFNRTECRPLHKAIDSGRRGHVRFLLDRGARVMEKDADGQDVVTYAKDRRHMRPEGWKAVQEWFAEKGLEVPEEGAKQGEEESDTQGDGK